MIEVTVGGVRVGPFDSPAAADAFLSHDAAAKLEVLAEEMQEFGWSVNLAAFGATAEPVDPAAVLSHYDYWYGGAE